MGTELRLAGARVTNVPPGSRVWAADQTQAYVTSGGDVRRCTPTGCAAPTSPLLYGSPVSTMAIGAGDEAYVVDLSGNIYRQVGSSWDRITTLASGMRNPVIVEPGHLVGIGGVGEVVEWRADGGGTTVCSTPVCGNNSLDAVGGHWPDRMVAVGHSGRIVARDPATGTWAAVTHELTDVRLRQVVTAGDRVLVRGDSDVVLQLDARGWMRANLSQVDAALTSIAGHADGSIWVRGQTGLYELIDVP
ncbi:MAG: hypothetical protein R2939_13075 [Kofleriaceae bacterium]